MLNKKLFALSVLVGVMLIAVACGGDAEDIEEQVNDLETEPPEEENEGNAENENAGNEGTEDENGEESALDRILAEGTVRVGVANEEPYGYQTPDGETTGAAVEIARAIFEDMGVEEIEGEVTEFGSLIPGLQAGRFDLVTAGMDIRPERCAEAAFADIEMRYGEGMAVAPGNPHDLHSYEDIADNPDVTVSVMAGANQHDFLAELGVDEDQIETADSISSNISAVESGRVDATTMTEATVRDAVASAGDGVELVEDFEQPIIDGEDVMSYGAAAFSQGEDELVEAYNEGLQELKDSGRLLEILEEFGFSEDNLPDETTTEERCQG